MIYLHLSASRTRRKSRKKKGGGEGGETVGQEEREKKHNQRKKDTHTHTHTHTQTHTHTDTHRHTHRHTERESTIWRQTTKHIYLLTKVLIHFRSVWFSLETLKAVQPSNYLELLRTYITISLGRAGPNLEWPDGFYGGKPTQ